MRSKRTHWQECEVSETLRFLNPKMGIYTLGTYSRQNKQNKTKMIRLPSLSLETWPPEKNAVDCTRALTFTLLVFNAAIV